MEGSNQSRDTVQGTHDRRNRIVQLVRERLDLSVSDLCEALQASPASIRRDLRALESRGLIRRSYGRVSAVRGSLWELPIQERRRYLTETYAKMAQAAAAEIDGADTIFLDEGNLPGMLASRLPTSRQMTVVTASLRTALTLAETSPHEVVMVGGNIRKRTLASTGYWAREMLAGMSIDLSFMGANGISVTKGLTTPDERVAQIKKEAIRSANRNIVLCPSDRFAVSKFVEFASLDDIDLFITDPGISHRLLGTFREAGAEVQIAG